MTKAILKPLTFEEFVAWRPEDGGYELIDGIATEMQLAREHEDVTEFVATALMLEVNRLQTRQFRMPGRRGGQYQFGSGYACNSEDYKSIGIAEFWIIWVYEGRNTSAPKQPTMSICTWVKGNIKLRSFEVALTSSLLHSQFPEVQLTADQFFIAGR